MATTPGPKQRNARKQAAFLEAYAKVGNVAGAARQAGIERVDHYRWLKADKTYAERFESAEAEAADTLEQEARRRALIGVDRPIFHKGEQVGSVKQPSDTLLIFLLKGALPAKYRENVNLDGKLDLNAAEDLVERLARGRQRVKK
jgi:hypothetical protein